MKKGSLCLLALCGGCAQRDDPVQDRKCYMTRIRLDGVVVVSDGEQIVCSNRAELTGLTAAEESNRYIRQENTLYGLSQITDGKRTWYGGDPALPQ